MIDEDFTLQNEAYIDNNRLKIIGVTSQPQEVLVKKRKYIKRNKIGFLIKKGKFIYSFE